MDIRDEENYVSNNILAKLTGLNKVLKLEITTKCRGQSVYHMFVAFVILYQIIFSTILIVSGVYYWTDNLMLSVDYFWKGFYSLNISYQMCVLVYHSDGIRNCLSITRYSFTCHSHRDRYILDRWRERSSKITTTLAVVIITSAIIYTICSMALSYDMLLVKNQNGSISSYRQNLINLYLFVSDETYNVHYNVFYIFEAFETVIQSLGLTVFDIILVTLCLAIRCQMQMICHAFESVGHKPPQDSHSQIVDQTNEKKNISNKHSLIYEELKQIIMDHQAVMKKYVEFLNIFKQVVLIYVVILSILVIALCFCFIMSLSDDVKFKTSEITTFKMLGTIPTFLFQIFIVCYLFGNLHDQKDSVIFALYSSNWTEMDIKCKKLILLTMKMNNANQKKLKLTKTRIVNFEMFFK
ncbi:hypothetical protein ACI65C_007212, partial [Semiaphis heraclei]